MASSIAWPGAWLAVAVAPVIGSFMATVIVRLPRGESLRGRSACRSCGARLGARDLVPLVSWFVQGGRCRYCHEPVSWIYPASEFMAVVIALWALVATNEPATAWVASLVGWLLWVAALIDHRHFLLPDVLTLPLLIGGLAWSWATGEAAFIDAAIGATAGYAAFVAIAWAYRRWRGRDGLGLGDAKLLAAAGAWLGWAALPTVVLIAGVAALLSVAIRRVQGERVQARTAIAFGSFLALAFWVVLIHGGTV